MRERRVKRTSSKPMAPSALIADLRRMIEEARSATAVAVNAALTTLYWHIGKRLNEDVLQGQRADYGKEIVSALGRELAEEYGPGFSDRNLWHMMRFAEAFPDEKILSALRRELTWTHFKRLIYLQEPLKRDFYAEMCRIERWVFKDRYSAYAILNSCDVPGIVSWNSAFRPRHTFDREVQGPCLPYPCP